MLARSLARRPRPMNPRSLPPTIGSRIEGSQITGPKITVRGAREHNLKNVDVEIPRDRLVVVTGMSGAGKSTLAFDTISAEAQRRYVDSLSASAHNVLALQPQPDQP